MGALRAGATPTDTSGTDNGARASSPVSGATCMSVDALACVAASMAPPPIWCAAPAGHRSCHQGAGPVAVAPTDVVGPVETGCGNGPVAPRHPQPPATGAERAAAAVATLGGAEGVTHLTARACS